MQETGRSRREGSRKENRLRKDASYSEEYVLAFVLTALAIGLVTL